MKSPKVAKKKCSKWAYRKWILEYLELNVMYSLFGQNSQNFLQSHVVCVEIEQSENFGYFGQKSKYVSFNSRYSKIKSLYTHFEHFFFCNFWAFHIEVRTSHLASDVCRYGYRFPYLYTSK